MFILFSLIWDASRYEFFLQGFLVDRLYKTAAQ